MAHKFRCVHLLLRIKNKKTVNKDFFNNIPKSNFICTSESKLILNLFLGNQLQFISHHYCNLIYITVLILLLSGIFAIFSASQLTLQSQIN